MKIFLDVHKPVIDRDTWEKVQAKHGKTRKRTRKNGEHNMFSGLLKCADCGGNLQFHFNQKNPEIQYFNCAANNQARKTCPTTHYIRVDFLEQVILGEIGRLTKFAKRHEKQFAELVMGQSQEVAANELKRGQKELANLKARDREIDTLIESLYESNISGKISCYEQEQGELVGKIKALSAELEKATDKTVTADMFLSTVRKYTRVKKLTAHMLNELIAHIEVYHAEKIDGIYQQRLKIHYHCIGEIEIPDTLTLPEITMNTRKGVTVAYSPNMQSA